MPLTRKAIEKNWLKNFFQCPLVDKQSKSYNSELARQFFYGKTSADFPADYPDNYQAFRNTCAVIDRDIAIDSIAEYLQFVGIVIEKALIVNHLSQFPEDFAKLITKCYYLFRTLAHAGDRLDLTNPFQDNNGDLYFLLRIASGESVTGGQLNLFEDTELPELYNRYVNIPEGFDSDPVIKSLFNGIESDNGSYFITGKAGTGKSTFIHYFAQNTKKNVLLVAFTGIAAINIGGQTIHSFFRLPIRPLLPEDEDITLFRSYQEKYKIIQNVQTIVIDEVSMLRADILEAIDFSLRRNGGDPTSVFGGKQILFVGDIFQLPPVINEGEELERILFNEFYRSGYFFDSPAYKTLNPRFVELEKVHRQSEDAHFVQLLNTVRNCTCSKDNLTELNQRYFPMYEPKQEEFVIHLATTKDIVSTENSRRLTALNHVPHYFEATITGEFKEDRYPTNKILELKKNAQVIFIKNDSGRRWVNGTIAKIDFIASDVLEIRLQNGTVHKLERVTWENRKYKYDREKKRVVSEVLGTFTQFPVKLAWAITIHKSQGLTFDNVIVDLGIGAFVNGQVYTALSRCRTLKGITLKKKIQDTDIIADQRVISFYETEYLLSIMQE